MEAHNFLRQYLNAIGDVENLKVFNDDVYLKNCKSIIEKAKKAPKFLMPKSGRIFDDKLKGLPENPKLPFEQILIEYEGAGTNDVIDSVLGNSITSKKRIILASQLEDKIINIVCIFSVISHGYEKWILYPVTAALFQQCTEEEMARATSMIDVIPEQVIKKNKIEETNKNGLIKFQSLTSIEMTKETERNAWFDMADEVRTIYELIEALSCRNVVIDKLPARKLNKAAKKNGALPFDDYHVLSLLKPSRNGTGTEQGYDRHSPREHLRRGHIRRLPSGDNIWINSCVVNAGNGGRIHKVYDAR